MTRLPKSVLSLGAIALVACGLTLTVPRAAHAFASALVQVTNTPSSPVPIQDVDVPGRHPYQQTCNSISSESCTLPVVAANTELVIQTVSILSVFSNVAPLGELVTTGGGEQAESYFSLVLAQSGQYAATQALIQYADPGTQPTCQTTAQHALESAVPTFFCTVTGYTISLP
jgi:hypothetical protein